MGLLLFIICSGLPGRCLSDGTRRGSELPSADSCDRVVRRTYSHFGDRCFAAAELKLGSSIPVHRKLTDINFERLKRSLNFVCSVLRRWQIVTSC